MGREPTVVKDGEAEGIFSAWINAYPYNPSPPKEYPDLFSHSPFSTPL